MKVTSIAVAGVAVVLIALTLVPAAGGDRPYFAFGALVCALVVLVTIVVGWRQAAPVSGAGPQAPAATPRSVATARDAPTVPAAAPPPAQAAPGLAALPQPSGEAEVVALLAVLQEKGRLVDFLQDDITSYSDAQVGAAARVVHAGCKAVLSEYFRIVPVRAENEGAKVTVAPGYAADEYRLVGRISGQAPFNGTLMHRGWKTESVTLPRVLQPADDRLPIIAPAEVELR
jgi:hypothetical protein